MALLVDYRPAKNRILELYTDECTSAEQYQILASASASLCASAVRWLSSISRRCGLAGQGVAV